MYAVPITIEPFATDDPNANYGVQLTGDLQTIVTDETKSFFMIERFNSAMSARLRLNNGDMFCFQLTFSSDVNSEAVHAAYLLNMTSVFLTQHSEVPDDGQDRALIVPPVRVTEGTGCHIYGSTLVMSPPRMNEWEFGRHCFQTSEMEISMEGAPGEQVLMQMHVTGTVGIQTNPEGPLYYLPFSHDPFIVVST